MRGRVTEWSIPFETISTWMTKMARMEQATPPNSKCKVTRKKFANLKTKLTIQGGPTGFYTGNRSIRYAVLREVIKCVSKVLGKMSDSRTTLQHRFFSTGGRFTGYLLPDTILGRKKTRLRFLSRTSYIALVTIDYSNTHSSNMTALNTFFVDFST